MMLTWTTVLLAAGTLVGLASAMALVLGWANKTFYVKVDPRVEALLNALPGANCGGCGYVGCRQYAEAVAKGEAPVNQCTVGAASVAEALAAIMGVELEETWPRRAVVHCSATAEQRLRRADYHGEPTCSAANLISGVQGCVYGCLGLGDCVRACEFAAIHIQDGLATVDYDKCTGCGACVRACPRNIISLVPFKSNAMVVVACSNRDFGPEVKSVCTVGCIGCKLCEKENALFHMEGHLPIIDYDSYDPAGDFEPVLKKCPVKCLTFVGHTPQVPPEAPNYEAVTDEVLATS